MKKTKRGPFLWNIVYSTDRLKNQFCLSGYLLTSAQWFRAQKVRSSLFKVTIWCPFPQFFTPAMHFQWKKTSTTTNKLTTYGRVLPACWTWMKSGRTTTTTTSTTAYDAVLIAEAGVLNLNEWRWKNNYYNYKNNYNYYYSRMTPCSESWHVAPEWQEEGSHRNPWNRMTDSNRHTHSYYYYYYYNNNYYYPY